ncbi:MAG: hypothetical protein U5L45_05270 [Saprospiraceae bacterium]|nr:hypothetical protein [Saprospiraceae bacterium]
MVHFSAKPKNEPHSPFLRERSESVWLNSYKKKKSMFNLKKINLKNTPSVYGVIFFVFFTFSCSNADKTCKSGTPKAIFTNTMPTVKKHYFELKKEASGEQVGVEMVAFENKLLLEIEQSGCNAVVQQFSFIMFGKFPEQTNDELWKALAVRHFRDLAKLDPTLTAFNAWADAIETVKKDLKLGETMPLSDGFTARVDKIVSADKATLVVQFSQK